MSFSVAREAERQLQCCTDASFLLRYRSSARWAPGDPCGPECHSDLREPLGQARTPRFSRQLRGPLSLRAAPQLATPSAQGSLYNSTPQPLEKGSLSYPFPEGFVCREGETPVRLQPPQGETGGSQNGEIGLELLSLYTLPVVVSVAANTVLTGGQSGAWPLALRVLPARPTEFPDREPRGQLSAAAPGGT